MKRKSQRQCTSTIMPTSAVSVATPTSRETVFDLRSHNSAATKAQQNPPNPLPVVLSPTSHYNDPRGQIEVRSL